MKNWVALYVKEWKDSAYMLAFLVIALVALQIYGWYLFDPELAGASGGGWVVLPFVLGFVACVIVPPFLLARSFSSEFKSETHYLWFSLPVNRWVTVICKYAVALINGFILWMIAAGSMVLLLMKEGKLTKLNPELSTASFGQISGFLIDLCVVFVVPFLLYMMLLLALVTAMEGLKFSVRRFQGLAALTFFGGMIYLYARSYTTAVDSLSFLGRYNTVGFGAEGSMKGVMQLSHLAYPFLASTVLLFAGLWLFEKRVEI